MSDFGKGAIARKKTENKSMYVSVSLLIKHTQKIFQVVNKPDHGNLDWVRVCKQSSKVITFIDLAGHERYLKTTVFGMTGHAPDFGKWNWNN